MVDFQDLDIDLDQAIAIEVPPLPEKLEPGTFRAADGRGGWAVRFPEPRPIATPAFWKGMLFVGGGYGSHSFYAFDAESGRMVWKMQTADDGPTAAVVEDDLVAFNTESCTVIVAEAATGKVVWQEWLGDPLMSQPAIDQGRLYMAYPSGQRKSAEKSAQWGHRMLCADLRTGRHLWEQEISGDVITAPVVSGGKVHFTCLDGTSYCLDAASGEVVWRKEDAGTTSPIVAEGKVIGSRKRVRQGWIFEGVHRSDALRGEDEDREPLAEGAAEYLRAERGGGVGIKQSMLHDLDAGVGFASAPSSAKLKAAALHLGTGTVAGAWAYQGSRAAYSRGRILNAQGSRLNCLRSKDGAQSWRRKAKGTGLEEDGQVFCPPALGKEGMYLCSIAGHLISVRQDDGTTRFLYATRQPMAFQPTLAEGNMLVGTANGLLLCLHTGDPDADGWTMWGGNAQHNKT